MRVGTLFSGVGAPEVAISSLGINHEIVFACEIDPQAREVYRTNHKVKYLYEDVRELAIGNVPEVDLLIFGFPCQPYSIAGNTKGLSDARGRLVFDAISILRKSKAKMFIGENVKNIRALTNDFDIIKSELSRDHHLDVLDLNSLDFGVAQNRERVWFVGNNFSSNIPWNNMLCKYSRRPLCNFLDKKVDKSYWATSDFLNKPKVKNRLSNYKSDYINCITQTISRNGSSSEYISYVSALNRAIGQTRKPTPRECFRLFGFPEDFNLGNICKTKQYIMAANTMAVPVIGELIKCLHAFSQ